MKDLAVTMEGIVRQQLAHIAAESNAGVLPLEQWEALDYCAKVVRTLAINNVAKEKGGEQLPEGMSLLDVARALDDLRSGKLK